jgi:Fe2+ transport system protein FeoA
MARMIEQELTCPMCGHRFDPHDHAACGSCPLQRGCQLVCCPNCGYEMIDVKQSRLASAAAGLFSLGQAEGRHASAMTKPGRTGHGRHNRAGHGFFSGKWGKIRKRRKCWKTAGLTLAEVPLGYIVKVVGFSPALSPDRRAHLQAYGLVPGYQVLVTQHSPVTVVRVENTELALEDDLAGKIQVQVES